MLRLRLDFDWDDPKAEANFAKHLVRFDFAARVFLDPARVDFDASREQDRENRRKAVGEIDGKLYVVVYTERGGARRIISARRCNAMERKAYDAI